MLWFKAQQTDHLICMETTVVDSYAFHTVLDPGFFLHKMKRDSMPHNHLNHELYFIEAGTCTAKCGKDVLVCTQGDLLLIPIGVEHNVHTLSEDASLYSLRFSCPMLKMPQAPTILHSQRTAKLLSMLRDELACLRPYTLEGVIGLLQMFYAELLHLLFLPL